MRSCLGAEATAQPSRCHTRSGRMRGAVTRSTTARCPIFRMAHKKVSCSAGAGNFSEVMGSTLDAAIPKYCARHQPSSCHTCTVVGGGTACKKSSGALGSRGLTNSCTVHSEAQRSGGSFAGFRRHSTPSSSGPNSSRKSSSPSTHTKNRPLLKSARTSELRHRARSLSPTSTSISLPTSSSQPTSECRPIAVAPPLATRRHSRPSPSSPRALISTTAVSCSWTSDVPVRRSWSSGRSTTAKRLYGRSRFTSAKCHRVPAEPRPLEPLG